MSKLLHIIASPRKGDSKSTAVALAHIEARRRARSDLVVDTLDLWDEPLPEFDGDRAAAKMTFFGEGELDGTKKTAWDEIVRITQRFIEADHYVLGVPMWNGGIPYRLKLYIDIMTQPGLLFGFDPTAGYTGLLKNKTATVIYTSGVYAPGVPPTFGLDFQSSYLEWWLDFIGISEIERIRFQPTLMSADPLKAFEDTLAIAQAVVRDDTERRRRHPPSPVESPESVV